MTATPKKRDGTSPKDRIWAIRLLLLIFCLTATRSSFAFGTWVPLVNQAPGGIDNSVMLLLSDGRVIASDGGISWYCLTPSIHGSYINGTWSVLSSMHDSRSAFASQVLTNGQIFIGGGEHGGGQYSAEVYDPLLNHWTMCPGAGSELSDAISEILPSGNVLIAPNGPTNWGETMIYAPASNQWIAGPQLYDGGQGGNQAEASWVKLPDSSILTVDPFSSFSERYIPSLNRWIQDANVPVSLYGNTGELGYAMLLQNGNVLFLGATGNTAIYAPSGSTNMGTWTTGPVIPNGQATIDSPAAMMANGRALCMVSPYPTAGPPNSFYEFDSVSNEFTLSSNPGNSTNYYTEVCRMLDLPDGTVLFSYGGSQLYAYQPDGTALTTGEPSIISITTNYYQSYHLTGTLLNGISEGAGYGDDAQMNSNYPLVRMTNNATGSVYYARTYNWSSTSVMTGTNIVSTEFMVPANLPAGNYSLVVVANGNASAPVAFTFNPDPLKITELSGFVSSGPIGGPFEPNEQAYFLKNSGTSSLNWTLVSTSQWLNVTSTGGSLVAGGQSTVIISVNSSATNMSVGQYTAVVWITNLSTGVSQSIPFELEIDSILQNGGFEYGSFADWDISGNLGGSSVVGNFSGSGTLNSDHSGNFSAFLGMNNSMGYLSQTLPTAPGQSYLLSLFVNSLTAKGSSNEFAISWDGLTLFDQQEFTTIGWTNLQFIVWSTSGRTDLEFEFQSATNYFRLDDVFLTNLPPTLSIASQPINQVVPEGGAASFSVLANDSLPMFYQWSRSGTNITNGNRVSGTTNTILNINDAAVTDSGTYTVVVSDGFQSVTSLDATLTVFDTNNAGFIVYPWHTSINEPNDVAIWAEEQILGLRGPNYAVISNWPDSQNARTEKAMAGAQGWYFVHTNYINWDIQGYIDGAGDFTSSNGIAGYPKQEFPGIVSGNFSNEVGFATSDVNNFSMLVETWLYFPTAGYWQMGVNSDDGFSLKSGQSPGDIFGQLLGEYEGGRGASDTIFSFYASQPGLYPFRLLYEQGGGGANCEWFTVTSSGQRVLINDSSQGANAVYSYLSLPESPIYVSGVIPVIGATGISSKSDVTAFVVDGSSTQVAFVNMWINGLPAFVNMSRSNNVTTASMLNINNPHLLLPAATNTVTIVYSDNASRPKNYTNSWQFVTLNDSGFGSGISPNCAISAPEGLVAWWTGNNTPDDFFGLRNGLIESGVTYSPGEVGYAFNLDGNSGYIDFGNQIGNFGTNDFTITFWMATTSADSYDVVFAKRGSSGHGSFWDIFTSSGYLTAELDQDESADNYVNVQAQSRHVNDGVFHHVALSRQSKQAFLYLDGALITSSVSAGITIISNNAECFAGYRIYAPNYWPGILDEVQVYNRALSASEIQASYMAGSNGMCAQPRSCFRGPPTFSKSSGFVVNAKLRSGQVYTLESNTNLETTNWLVLTNFTAGTTPVTQLTNSSATNIPEQFYRIVSP